MRRKNKLEEVITMILETATATVRQNLGELLNQLQQGHEVIVITDDGKPVAALVDIELFDRIQAMRETFEQTLQALNAAYNTVPAEQAEAEIAKAVAFARNQRRQPQ
jgi:prevent-host-death family protein